MSEIIDILTQNKNETPFFVVNTAVDFVNIEYPTPAHHEAILYNASAVSKLVRGDSFSILSAGLVLPEAFTLWKNPVETSSSLAILQILLKGLSAAYYAIDVLGNMPFSYLPMENHELSLDIFVDVPRQRNITNPGLFLTEAFEIEAELKQNQISMKGVPTAYHGKKLFVSPFIKILHNYPMYSIPV